MSDGKQLEYEEDGSAPQQHGYQDSGSDLPIQEGVVIGAIAVIATYFAHLIVTLVTAAQTSPTVYTDSQGQGSDPTLVVTELVSSWKAAGWSYVASFGTGFEANGEAATLSDAPNNVAALSNAPFFLVNTLLFIGTIGGVVAAGYAVAKYTDADDPVDAVKAAVTVVVPYLVFAALVALVMSHTYSDQTLVGQLVGGSSVGSPGNVPGLEYSQFFNDQGDVTGEVTFGPGMTDAILFAGILIPVVLSAAGGLLTQWQDAVDTAIAKVNER